MDPLNTNLIHQLASRHSLEIVELGANNLGAYWTTPHDENCDLCIRVNIHYTDPWPLLNNSLLELGLDKIVVIDVIGKNIITQSIEFFEELGSNGLLNHTWRSVWAYKTQMITAMAEQILSDLMNQSHSDKRENDDCNQGIVGL